MLLSFFRIFLSEKAEEQNRKAAVEFSAKAYFSETLLQSFVKYSTLK